MKYRYILFDADNTLFDFDSAQRLAFFEALSRLGIEPGEEYLESYHGINESWWKKLERAETTHERLGVGRFAELIAKHGFDGADPESMNQLYREQLSSHGILLPGAYELVESLYTRCQMYIITNGMSLTQHRRFDDSPLRRMINEIFVSQDIGFEKPDRRFFDYVLDTISERFPSMEKRQVLVVGDSMTSDIKGANNSGLDSCLVDAGGRYDPETAVGSAAPDYVIRSLSGLPGILEQP